MNAHENDKSKEPQNDYLWDRSGTPDLEIQRLEFVLSEFRYEDRPLVLPANQPAARASTFLGALLFPRPAKKGWLPARFTAAAVLLLALTATLFFTLHRLDAPTNNIAWNVSTLEGAPQIGTKILFADQAPTKLQVGQTLTTNSSSRATLFQNDLGQIQIDPDSQLRLLQSGPNHKRIQLDLGTIHAYIWAPPTQFVVDTPSAVAIDLGCAYTLHVEPDGSGIIRTTLGWVGFHLNGRDSFIPAGAMCHTRPNVGPGTPYFEDASESFREALDNFDHQQQSAGAASQEPAVQQQLKTILRESRPKDALTLWHLLSRTESQERVQVYDRLAALVPPPTGVTREAILQLDPHSLDLYWNALNLGDISIWRYFEQSSNPNNQEAPQFPQQKQPHKEASAQ